MSQNTDSRCHPALIVVPGQNTTRGEDEPHQSYSYTDTEHLPPESEILDVLKEALEEQCGNAQNLLDVYEDDVKIQHEVPPTEPYDARGVVAVFGQSEVIANEYSWESPFETAIDALKHEYGREVEIWIDGVML